MPSLRELARNKQQKPEFPEAKQISWKKDSIIVTEFKDGKGYKTHYDEYRECRNCGTYRLISGNTGGSCPICDKTISLKDYLEHFPVKQSTKSMYFKKIVSDTGLTPKEIMDMVDEKKEELKGLISEEGALFVIGKELGVELRTKIEIEKEQKAQDLANENLFTDDDVKEVKTIEYTKGPKKTKETKKPKKVIDITEETKETPMTTAITVPKTQETRELTFNEKKELLLERIKLYEFMTNEILDREKDYHVYKNGNEHIKRSGCIKLATAFNLSIEPLSIIMEKDYDKEGNEIDIHAHARCKIFRSNDSFVIGTGTKSKSEYWSERYKSYGSYNLHNLRTTAMTKASNHGIIDAIGFAQVSYDEIGDQNITYDNSDDSDNDSDLF